MQNIKHLLTGSLLILLSLSAFSQSQSLNFTIQSNSVEIDGDIIEMQSNMVKLDNELVWTQQLDGNELKTTYTITNETENWNKGNSQGEVVYALEINGYQNTLTITGDSNGVSAILSTVKSNGQNENYVFNISTITYN